MPYDVIIGRNESDKKAFGKSGLMYLGKSYVKMGNQTSLSNPVFMDVARSHVVLVAGKRGSGKSYTLGTIAEELSSLPSEVSKNLSSLVFDTMGIFWTMKYENKKDSALLQSWNLKPKALPVKVFIPEGKADYYKERGIPIDQKFALKPSELEAEDWINIFNLELTSLPGILIERTLIKLKDSKTTFTLSEVQHHLESDHKASKETKEIASSLFGAADSWGIFSKSEEGTKMKDLLTPGATTVLDVSVYSTSTAFNIRALVISIISRKIFKNRMDARKREELESLRYGQDYMSYQQTREDPLVWIFIDEAHEFLPSSSSTPATAILQQLLREGRQPGISLVLATQQPGQIHKDVMTQSDIVISHRVTSKPDVTALNNIMQSYLLESIQKNMDDLPSLKGSAIVLDDNSERIFPIRIRPRFTWHGGEAPTAIKAENKL
jgi:uncharacterized protein